MSSPDSLPKTLCQSMNLVLDGGLVLAGVFSKYFLEHHFIRLAKTIGG